MEGLEDYYDLVIVGTGLAESILSGAASRRGKKVLHLEKNDLYGDAFAAFNFSGFLEEFSKYSSKDKIGSKFYVVKESDVSSNFENLYSEIRKTRKPIHPRLQGELDLTKIDEYINESNEDGSEDINPVCSNFQTKEQFLFAYLLSKDRDISIDMTPKIMFSTGAFIDNLVNSGVSKYLEFKALDAVYFYLSRDYHPTSSAVWKTPCTKNDIFNSKQLSALEKRCLMKFHQYVADWGRTHAGEDVKVLNENQLAIGRSLYRPQNKSISNEEIDNKLAAYKTFDDLLNSFQLSKKLQALVRYGLCLHSHSEQQTLVSPKTVKQSLTDLALHFNSLARYGETAFLFPYYGISELVQGYCRLSAVWGGTFILRRSIQSFEEEDGDETIRRRNMLLQKEKEAAEIATTMRAATEESEKDTTSSTVPPVPATTTLTSEVVVADMQLPPPPPATIAITSSVEDNGSSNSSSNSSTENPTEELVHPPEKVMIVIDSEGNRIRCGHVIMNYAYQPTLACAAVMSLQSIVLLAGKVFEKERSIGIIPPFYQYNDVSTETSTSTTSSTTKMGLENPFAIHLIQADSSTSSMPEGFTMLNIHTLIEDPLVKDGGDARYGTWSERAAARAVYSEAFMTKITSIILKEIDSSQETLLIYQNVFLRPIFASPWQQDVNHPQVIYTGDWQSAAMHFEDDTHTAQEIYRTIFPQEITMFDEDVGTQEEDDDFDNEKHEYEVAYKFATTLQQHASTSTVDATAAGNEEAKATTSDEKVGNIAQSSI